MSKEVIIPFKCTEAEKAALQKVAVVQNGLSITEFMRYKLFNETNEEDLNDNEEDLAAGFIEQISELEGLIKNLRSENKSLQKVLDKTKSKENVFIIPEDLLQFVNDFVNNDTPSNLDGNGLRRDIFERLNKDSFIEMCILFMKQNTEPSKGVKRASEFALDYTTT